ncbi:Rpn family recombination-promoting nuclease/putative transposase [Methanobrevibacter sp. OttesenSCG-928-I08]|nr:Rpn family recombination-promoting nuclease/putative transposase [Methanobrevibacter sp. OttesenSCG-928-I08]
MGEIKIKNDNIDLKHYNPLNDFLFSKYMAEKGCEHILLSFLNALFNEYDKKINSVEIIENKSLITSFKDEKDCILDLRAITDNGEKIIMEMQQRNANEFRGRSLNYIFKEYSRSPKKSKEYNYIPHILINIMNFEFCEESNFYTKFDISETRNKTCKYSDLFTAYNIDLVKFRKEKKIDINNKLTQWCIFLCQNHFSKEFKEVLKMNEEIKSAHEKIEDALGDGEEAWLYERIERKKQEIRHEIRDAKIDARKEGLKEGKEEGLKEGKEEGLKEGKEETIKEIAIKLKDKGILLKEIAEITNLPIETIKRL